MGTVRVSPFLVLRNVNSRRCISTSGHSSLNNSPRRGPPPLTCIDDEHVSTRSHQLERRCEPRVAPADDDDVIHGSTPFWSGARCDGHARRSISIVTLQRDKKGIGGSKLGAASKSLVSRVCDRDFLGAGCWGERVNLRTFDTNSHRYYFAT